MISSIPKLVTASSCEDTEVFDVSIRAKNAKNTDNLFNIDIKFLPEDCL